MWGGNIFFSEEHLTHFSLGRDGVPAERLQTPSMTEKLIYSLVTYSIYHEKRNV
jgi:hypothetical protein